MALTLVWILLDALTFTTGGKLEGVDLDALLTAVDLSVETRDKVENIFRKAPTLAIDLTGGTVQHES